MAALIEQFAGHHSKEVSRAAAEAAQLIVKELDVKLRSSMACRLKRLYEENADSPAIEALKRAYAAYCGGDSCARSRLQEVWP